MQNFINLVNSAIGEYENGMMDYPDMYKPLSKAEIIDYVNECIKFDFDFETTKIPQEVRESIILFSAYESGVLANE